MKTARERAQQFPGQPGPDLHTARQHPRILLLSAYRSASHGAWTDWLTGSLDTFDWQIRELPGRYFRWRIRGNPISWLNDLPPKTPDAVIATSMVDLATLRGLHPHLALAPTPAAATHSVVSESMCVLPNDKVVS